MRACVQWPVACAIGSLAVGLSGAVLAQQPVEEPEEIIVRAKPLNQYRVEVELARDEMIRVFNEANEGEDNDVRCRYEAPTGSRIPQRVCFSTAQDRASAGAARHFLNGLLMGHGSKSEMAEATIDNSQRARCPAGYGARSRLSAFATPALAHSSSLV